MKKYLLALLLALCGASAFAHIPTYEAGSAPACVNGSGVAFWVKHAVAADDCDTNGGSFEVLCMCADGTATAIGSGGGGGGNTFLNFDVPAGTDPAADDPADTLTWISGAAALTITGNSGTDTITLDISGTASKCARFDGSGELVAASGDCGNAITLDIGDDGGNDSTALSEIATENDDYSAIEEESADKAMIDFRQIPPYDNYDPLRPPAASNCAICDEFYDDTSSLTWSCNGESITQVYKYDAMKLTKALGGSNATNTSMCSTAAPSGSFVLYTRMHAEFHTGSNRCALSLIYTGTQASPTKLYNCGEYTDNGNGDNTRFFQHSQTSYTANGVDLGGTGELNDNAVQEPLYYRWIYDASADTLVCEKSIGGLLWNFASLTTGITSDPLFIGVMIDDFSTSGNQGYTNMNCVFDFIRARTDSNRNDASD